MNEYIQILITTPNKEIAQKIAGILVENKLCACVQILGPIESTYLWKGKIETENEYFCLMKSVKTLYKEIEKIICKNHPYEVPEIITTKIENGLPEYLNWIDVSTSKLD